LLSNNNIGIQNKTTPTAIAATTTIAAAVPKAALVARNPNSSQPNGPESLLRESNVVESNTIVSIAEKPDTSGDKLAHFINTSHELPDFGTIKTESIQLPVNCDLSDLKKFEEIYRHHCEKTLEIIVSLKFNTIEELWLEFWRVTSNPNSSSQQQLEEKLSAEKLFSLCQVKEVIDYVRQSDYQFYQFCVEILIPDLSSSLPHNLVQSIRGLAKSLENWLKNALVKVPEEIKQVKLLVIKTFSMTLRRYTSLNHLIQTLKSSLHNGNMLDHMLHDINKVDFNYIREQAKFICECDGQLISKFEKEFKETLKSKGSSTTIDHWIQWLDNSLTFYLSQFDHDAKKLNEMARQFLLKWSFFCSSIIRDLTLRSAVSFGSFHLVRLIYDEYMYYLIEHKIASIFKKTPLEVMANDCCLINDNNNTTTNTTITNTNTNTNS
jgi:regulatory factor X 1/2/3